MCRIYIYVAVPSQTDQTQAKQGYVVPAPVDDQLSSQAVVSQLEGAPNNFTLGPANELSTNSVQLECSLAICRKDYNKQDRYMLPKPDQINQVITPMADKQSNRLAANSKQALKQGRTILSSPMD